MKFFSKLLQTSIISNIWNWARGKGITDLPNPCEGIRHNKEAGCDVYVDDDTFRAVYVMGITGELVTLLERIAKRKGRSARTGEKRSTARG